MHRERRYNDDSIWKRHAMKLRFHKYLEDIDLSTELFLFIDQLVSLMPYRVLKKLAERINDESFILSTIDS